MPFAQRSSRHIYVRRTPADVVGPLSIHSSKRYLVDALGNPFLLNQEAAWSIGAYCSDSDVEMFLADRAARGINGLIIEFIERYSADNPHGANNPTGLNFYGDTPFTGTTTGGNEDLSTPRESFWRRMDWIIDRCAFYRIVVLAFPMYLGAFNGGEGWYQQLCANSDAKVQAYADFLTGRYGSKKNLLWIFGGDLGPGSSPTPSPAWATGLAKLELLRARVESNLPGAVTTGHFEPGLASSFATFALNNAYIVPNDRCLDAYALAGPLPYFGIEGSYAETASAVRRQIRGQSYTLMTCGACGITYGNPTWAFTSVSEYSEFANGLTWQQNIAAPSVLDHERVFRFFSSVAWYQLVPGGCVTAGGGTLGGTDYVSAAVTPTGSLMCAFVPHDHAGSVTIDMTKMSGSARARWLDPTNGLFTTDSGSPVAATGTHAFTIPGTNSGGDADWLLVLDL